ncbi:MAG: SWIM zinc finger family protein [Nitrospirota bacterium]
MVPAPREIKFSCSCPDWASMCKHVAAVLYGVGARLDEDPGLFFKLRNADMSKMIKQTVADRTEKLLEKASRKSGRIIAEADLSSVFGIDLEERVSSAGREFSASKSSRIRVKPSAQTERRKLTATKSRKKGRMKKAGERLSEKPQQKKPRQAKLLSR